MRVHRVFQHELNEVLQDSALAGAGEFASWSRSEHKAVQNLYAKALRRAVRRARSGGGRGRATS